MRAVSRELAFLFILWSIPFTSTLFAQNTVSINQDTLRTIEIEQSKASRHFIGIEFRPAYVIPSSPFYKNDYGKEYPTKKALAVHLQYSFAHPHGTLADCVFANTHQGIGVGFYNFGNHAELGTPLTFYLFQKSRISQLNPKLALDYEWNFGLSTGWKPYNYETNPNNVIVGSKVNAYINVGLALNWKLSNRLALIGGVDLTHFSNGNTEYPNAGLNSAGLKAGLLYDLSKAPLEIPKSKNILKIPPFPRHISYDFVFFGSWRRKGVDFNGQQIASPYKYPVLGAYFAPLYNFSYRFRAGLSLDAIYDASANVYTRDYISSQQDFVDPGRDKQMALGVSARGEYVMPIFTISMGLGTNVLHKGGDLKGTNQTLALKIRASRSSFLHIGYNLKDFHEPNYLMLGFGFKLNNRTPSLLSHLGTDTGHH